MKFSIHRYVYPRLTSAISLLVLQRNYRIQVFGALQSVIGYSINESPFPAACLAFYSTSTPDLTTKSNYVYGLTKFTPDMKVFYRGMP